MTRRLDEIKGFVALGYFQRWDSMDNPRMLASPQALDRVHWLIRRVEHLTNAVWELNVALSHYALGANNPQGAKDVLEFNKKTIESCRPHWMPEALAEDSE